jgi:hypothetical protein
VSVEETYDIDLKIYTADIMDVPNKNKEKEEKCI